MMPFGLELGDDDDGQHHPVLREPADRGRVGQQDAGVEDIGAAGRTGTNKPGCLPGFPGAVRRG
jgi:hypothetical protein